MLRKLTLDSQNRRQVEGYDFGWHSGTVTELGAGNYQGYYLIKYDKFNSSRWYQPKDMRSAAAAQAEAATAAATAATAAQGPRPGKYNIYSYGAVGAQPFGTPRPSRDPSRWPLPRLPHQFRGLLRPRRIHLRRRQHPHHLDQRPLCYFRMTGGFTVNGATHRIQLRSRTIATNTAQ